jgi:hypothetical protein
LQPTSVARLVLGGRRRWLAAFAPGATHRTTQEFGLLVRLLEAIPATRLAATTATASLYRRCVRLPILGRRRIGAVLDRLAVAAILTVIAVAAVVIAVIVPVIVAVAVPEAVLVAAPEVAITIGVVSGMARLMLLALLTVMLWQGLRQAVIQHVVAAALVLAELVAVATFAGNVDALAVAVHIAALLLQLLAIGHDDAVVVLGMLQVVLGEHGVAGRLRVASERQIFLGNMCRSAPDFHIGTIGFETARKRILALSIPVVIVAATAAILLSLPHCL